MPDMKRLTLTILFCLTLPLFVHGQGAPIVISPALKWDGLRLIPASGASITICSATATGTPCTPTVTIYSDVTLSTAAANPITTDSTGNIPNRFIAPSRYTYTLTGSGITSQGPIQFSTFSNDTLTVGKLDDIRVVGGAGKFPTIQAAHDDLPAAGGTIYVSDGDRTLLATTTFTKQVLVIFGRGVLTANVLPAFKCDQVRCSLVGAAKIMTTIRAGVASANPLVLVTHATGLSFWGSIRDINLDGSVGNLSPGIQLNNVREGEIKDVLINRYATYGVDLVGSWNNHIEVSCADAAAATDVCVRLNDSSASNILMTVNSGTGLDFITSPSNGVRIQGTFDGTAIGVNIPKLGLKAIEVANSFFEQGATAYIRVGATGAGATPENVRITGNSFAGTGAPVGGITFTDALFLSVEDNSFGAAVTYGSALVGLKLKSNNYASTKTVNTASVLDLDSGSAINIGGDAGRVTISRSAADIWTTGSDDEFQVPLVLRTPILTPITGDFADAGWLRAPNGHQFCWEASPAGTDVCVSVDASEIFQFTGQVTAPLYGTTTNCSSSASPAVCSAAPAGSVVIAAGATTVTVNTTAVTANSQILVSEDSSLGTRLAVTCNTTTGRTYSVTARTAGTSFVITASAAPAVNPACLSFGVIN